MISKPSTCVGCTLHEKGKGFVPDLPAPNKAEYVIYGEAPGKTEVDVGRPFEGKAGFVLKQWIMRSVPLIQLAAEKGKVSYCNVLKCLPPEVQGRPYPKGEETLKAEAHCKQYMIPNESAHTVILCGESPQRFFFGPELEAEDAESRQIDRDLKGVMGRIGRVYEKEGQRYVFAPHPAYLLRQPALVQHGQMAFQIAADTEKVLEPTYLDKWADVVKELL